MGGCLAESAAVMTGDVNPVASVNVMLCRGAEPGFKGRESISSPPVAMTTEHSDTMLKDLLREIESCYDGANSKWFELHLPGK